MSNGEDVFRWSGDRDANTGNNTQPTGEQDVYQYDGQPAGQDTPQNDNVPADWHPDYSLSSPGAKEWFKASQEQRKKPLDVDQNGDYVVKHGDSLWTIAERELHDQGKKGTNSEIEAEIQQIVKLNDKLHPSLASKPDFIRDGWTLHIRRPGERTDSRDTDCPPEQRCVPRPVEGEVTPPGYGTRPSVVVNRVRAENAYFDQSGGGSSDQCCPRSNSDDIFRYSGDQGRRQQGNRDVYQYDGQNDQGQGNRDVYQYDGQNDQGQGNRDVYQYDGQNDQGQGNRDVYQYDGQNDQGQGNRDVYQYDGRQDVYDYNNQEQPRNVPYNGTGNDGTSYYPGAGSAQDQLYRGDQCPPQNVIINEVYTENAYFDQSGNYDYNPSPQCRIMRNRPRQNGDDNYNNCRPRDRNQGRLVPLQNDRQYSSGNGSTDYFTYNPEGGQADDYYSRARSQQGYSVDGRPSTYRNPAGSDDEFAR